MSSFWWDQAGPPPPRPPLAGAREADVCIVGGGYTGLWTAYELRRADPSLEVVVLEREHVGFGASGRNGGWVVGELAGAPRAWVERGGRDGAHALEQAIRATVDEVARVVAEEGIACDLAKGGSLTVAQTPPQLAHLHAQAAADPGLELVDAAELRERVRIRDGLGATFVPHCARIQPARLVLGLAEAAERAGATIHERTPVLAVDDHRARTAAGDVRARHVVIATEGYTVSLPGRERVTAPVNSAMIATEPLGADAWAAIGWERAETILDGRHLYAYLQRTADGRIAIGGRGVPYRYGSQTAREGPVPQRTVDELQARLRRLFGDAADVPVARAWQGILGVTRTWLPAVGVDERSGVAWALGYAGEGVAASNLAARTLRDLLLGRDTELTRLPWVGPPQRTWEREPFRFAGIRGVHALLGAADAVEARTGRSSSLATLANRISGRV